MSESTSDSGNIKEDLFTKRINKKLFENANPTIINDTSQITNKNLFLDNQINEDNGMFSKFSPLPKPDFSTIEKRDSNFKCKERGSYKKPRAIVPESPMKSPNQKFFTPVKLQSNLFGNNSTSRKLNFTEINESPKEQENNYKDSTSTSKRNSCMRNLYENSNDESRSNLNSNKSNLFNDEKNNFSPLNFNKQDNLFERFGALKANDDIIKNGSNPHTVNNSNNLLNKDPFCNESRVFNNVFLNDREINFIMNKNANPIDSINELENDETITVDNETSLQTRLDSEFKILKTLESGTFGIVYKCLSLLDNNFYAIKKTKKCASKSEVSIMKNLIIDLNTLVKFNNLSMFVVKYKEAWVEEGLLLIKQEFCKYGDLLDFLQNLENNNFVFTQEFYWDIIFQMIGGIKYLHESGYIHLDIKPSNFFIGQKGVLKLGDFNLTRKKNKFNDDYFEGDSTYMAPEILEATKIKDLNEKCDIFSLGLTIIEILFKVELPQNGNLWRQIRSENFITPDDFQGYSNLKEIPKEFFELIYGMIHHDPKKRFDIQQILEKFPEIKLRLDYFNRKIYTPSYQEFIVKNDLQLEVGYSKSSVEKNFI